MNGGPFYFWSVSCENLASTAEITGKKDKAGGFGMAFGVFGNIARGMWAV